MSDNFEKFKNIPDNDERRVAEFLDKIGFSFIDSRAIFKKSESEVAREIDLLFSFQNCLFIIEVSARKTTHNEKIISFFYKWEKKQNLKRLGEKYASLPNNVMRIFFDLSTSLPENKSQEVEEATNEKGNKVVYKDEFEKYVSNNTEQTINDFLGVDWFKNTVKINSKISLFLNKINRFVFRN